MANTTLWFCEVVHCTTPEQRAWLLERFRLVDAHGGAEGVPYDPEVDYTTAEVLGDLEGQYAIPVPGNDDVLISSDETGDLSLVAFVVQAFQRRFGITRPWVLRYALTTENNQPATITGGAFVVTRGAIQTWSLDHWIDETLAHANA